MDDRKKERRRDTRVETELKADFRDRGDFANSFIGNISRGGILVKTDKPLRINDEFRLEFSIKGIERVFKTACRVMWIQELYDKYTDRMIPAMGCSFLELSREDLKIIEEYVISKSSSTN